MGGGHRGFGVRLSCALGLVLLAAASARAADYGTGAATNRALPVIEVWKGQRLMELREGDQVVRRFEVALGYSPNAQKRIRGDTRTPVGRYFICSKKPASQFHRFLGVSYPNTEDADRAYKEQLITAREWADLFIANLRSQAPSWRTALGGAVGIHGQGGRARSGDWTKGCVAVTDAEIDFIYDRVSIGTPVIINE